MRRLVPLLLAACGASSSSPPDAAHPDAAPLDASGAALDAAPFDAGSAPDAASLDAALDAAPLDAGCCKDDGVSCTREVCDGDDACAHVADDLLCASDGCQIGRCDPAAGCVGEPVDDGIPCGESAFGGPPPRCYSGLCVPGRVVAMQLLDLSIRSPVPGLALNVFDCLLRLSDVDGDGIDDIAACERTTSPDLDDIASNRGALQAYSTATGELLWSKSGSNEDAYFAVAIVSRPRVVGDLDGDGRVDLVASEREEPGVASLVAIDGTDGSEVWRVSKATSGLILDEAAGDRDGDGTPDVFAMYTIESPDSIELFLEILSGSDGAVIQSRSWSNELTGRLSSAIDDMDRDGLDDLIMRSSAVVIVDGQPLAEDEWTASVISSVSLDVIGTVEPPGDGYFCARVGDLNGDSTDELAFLESQPDWDNPVAVDLWAIDPTTGETAWSRNAEDQSCPTATYDLDGDGVRDLIHRSELGALSGSDGTVLLQEQFPADWAVWSRAVLQVGDLNGDGAEDWACGAGASWLDGNQLDHVLGIWFFASVVEY
ncbi:MAG: VCBS repeat-containing protein [Deltaproteobacteria bacterium]|nr:VCBS repeat-containing protein [Deltaproteobacteria bacterium]